MEDDREHKKAKGTNKCVIKRQLMFQNYKKYLFYDKIILKIQQAFRSDHHNVCTIEINKVALNSKMIRDYKHLINLQHIHIEQVPLKYVKVK